MNFRKLIEQAMHEVRDEFAVIVARKLAELMGDPSGSRSAASRAGTKEPARRGRPPKALKAASSRSRAPKDHMAQLREKVLSALQAGEAMKKAQIMKAARLDEAESARVANVLKKLKDDGVVSMKGQKAVATYTLSDPARSAHR